MMRLLILFALATFGLSALAGSSDKSCRIFLTLTFRAENGTSSIIPVENFKNKMAQAERSEVVGSHFNQVVIATDDLSEVIALSEDFSLEKVEHLGRTVPHYSSPIAPENLPQLEQDNLSNAREALFQALYLLPEGFYKLTDAHGGAFQLEFYFEKHSGQMPALHARLSSGFFLLPQKEMTLDRRTLAEFTSQPGLETGKSLIIRNKKISFFDPIQDPHGVGALSFIYDDKGVLSDVAAGPLQFEVQAFYPYSRTAKGFKIAPSNE
jgi:hypothetical protein